jgi:hypothetical protein
MVLRILYFINLITISSKILNIFKNIFAYLGMVLFIFNPLHDNYQIHGLGLLKWM